MRTRAQASRDNAKKSTGPHDTSSTRYNALKHGLLALGVTELDVDMYPDIVERFRADFRPIGRLEQLMVERLALLAVRLRRVGLLEAEFITAELNPPITRVEKSPLGADLDLYTDQVVVIDKGLPARLSVDAVDALSQKFQRYEAALEGRFFRTLHELQRLQRSRGGDLVPPPESLDVAVNADSASFGTGDSNTGVATE